MSGPFDLEKALAEMEDGEAPEAPETSGTSLEEYHAQLLAEEEEASAAEVVEAPKMEALPEEEDDGFDLGASARGAAQGLTFGFGDELSAGLAAGMGALTGQGDFSDLYSSTRDQIRSENTEASEVSPGSYAVGEMAGAVLSPMPGGVARGAGAAARGSRLMQLAKAAKTAREAKALGAAKTLAAPAARQTFGQGMKEAGKAGLRAGARGGAEGAAYSAGLSEEDSMGGVAMDALQGMAVAGGVSGGGTAAARSIKPLARGAYNLATSGGFKIPEQALDRVLARPGQVLDATEGGFEKVLPDRFIQGVDELKDSLFRQSREAQELIPDQVKLNVGGPLDEVYARMSKYLEDGSNIPTPQGRQGYNTLRKYAGLLERAKADGGLRGQKAKQLLMEIDDATRPSGPMKVAQITGRLEGDLKAVRKALDTELKSTVPEYAKAMVPVARRGKILDQIRKRGLDVKEETVGRRLKEAAVSPDRFKGRRDVLADMGEELGSDFLDAIDDTAAKDAFHKVFYQGSAGVKVGQFGGLALGSALGASSSSEGGNSGVGGAVGGMLGFFLMPKAGRGLLRAPAAVKKLGDSWRKLYEASPKAMQQIATLTRERGISPLAAHAVVSKQDPQYAEEYNRVRRELQEEIGGVAQEGTPQDHSTRMATDPEYRKKFLGE